MTSGILSEIQKSIRQKDEEMSWVDACCLQIAIKSSKGSRGAESCTFQTRDPNIKKEWIVGKSSKIAGKKLVKTLKINKLLIYLEKLRETEKLVKTLKINKLLIRLIFTSSNARFPYFTG